MSDVVTQPYDKITLEMQQQYHDASPFNLVRIILGKPESGDGDFSNVYTRAAQHFQQWRSEGILRQDPGLRIYQYVQRFEPPGGGRWQSVEALLHLEESRTIPPGWCSVMNRHFPSQRRTG